jgi:DNA-binding beta-propeller fold protein YncE
MRSMRADGVVMKREIILLLFLTAMAARDHMTCAATDGPPLRFVQTIPLPGVDGRIDHLAVDVAGQRLFVAALGNNTVEVIDLKKGERIHSLPGFKEPQGIAYLPETNTVAVANGGDGAVTLLDGATLKPTKTIAFGDDADNLRYDAARKRLYVGYGNGALGMLDPANGSRQGDIALDAHPESFQLEGSSGRIYVNVASRQKVAVADVNRSAVVATWPVAAGSANFPMALDTTHHRLFVVTRRPPHVVVFDTESGKTVATMEADGDADDVFYDAAQQRLYGCFGAGSVIVYAQRDADHYTVVAKVPTAAGARTGLFSPDLRRLFVAVPRRTNPTAEIRVFVTGS